MMEADLLGLNAVVDVVKIRERAWQRKGEGIDAAREVEKSVKVLSRAHAWRRRPQYQISRKVNQKKKASSSLSLQLPQRQNWKIRSRKKWKRRRKIVGLAFTLFSLYSTKRMTRVFQFEAETTPKPSASKPISPDLESIRA